MSCYFCGEDSTTEVGDSEVCDTYGGNYTYQQANYCKSCKRYFYTYTGWDVARIDSWDKAISESNIEWLVQAHPEHLIDET